MGAPSRGENELVPHDPKVSKAKSNKSSFGVTFRSSQSEVIRWFGTSVAVPRWRLTSHCDIRLRPQPTLRKRRRRGRRPRKAVVESVDGVGELRLHAFDELDHSLGYGALAQHRLGRVVVAPEPFGESFLGELVQRAGQLRDVKDAPLASQNAFGGC